MSNVPFPQAAITSLQKHSASIAQEAAVRMRVALPRYAGIPLDKLAAQNQRTVGQIAQMMDESNFAVAREYFEKLTETRARAGIPVTHRAHSESAASS